MLSLNPEPSTLNCHVLLDLQDIESGSLWNQVNGFFQMEFTAVPSRIKPQEAALNGVEYARH